MTDRDQARLTYFPGSPFARMCRVLVHEWDLPVEPVEHAFPPGPEMYAINPLGQVPALILGDRTVFPTFLVLETLWDMAGRPDAYRPDDDRQPLLTVLQMGDAYTAACYQRWSGLGPVGHNAVGYDPAARNLERVAATLDWLETGTAIREGLSMTGVALACLCLWADAREGLDWRSRAKLRAVVDALSGRDSFRATAPMAWSYSGT
ncbi:glutathione S-transferase [Rhodobacterales bacterium HKCCE3408]|nr:glutathione S-transferase [Rhodobacterales bacterium HKCCE3408]